MTKERQEYLNKVLSDPENIKMAKAAKRINEENGITIKEFLNPEAFFKQVRRETAMVLKMFNFCMDEIEKLMEEDLINCLWAW